MEIDHPPIKQRKKFFKRPPFPVLDKMAMDRLTLEELKQTMEREEEIFRILDRFAEE